MSHIRLVTEKHPRSVFRSGVPVVDTVVHAVPRTEGAVHVEVVVAHDRLAEAERHRTRDRHEAGAVRMAGEAVA
jgi:hypothetical protein